MYPLFALRFLCGKSWLLLALVFICSCSDEDIAKHPGIPEGLPFITFLKFRASYGVVGNDRLDKDIRFPFLSTMTEGNGAGIWDSDKNIAESQEASQNLRWEKTKKFDIGIDGQLFNGSVDFTVDFFNECRTGIFQQRASIPDEMGSKESLREAIKLERKIKFALEAPRYHDLRRWRDAATAYNAKIIGWNTKARSNNRAGFYTRTI